MVKYLDYVGTKELVNNIKKNFVTKKDEQTILKNIQRLEEKLNNLYPIGSVYISVNNVSPATFLGGTWTEFAVGRTLVGVNPSDTDFSTANKTGGSKELQSHSHGMSHTHNMSHTHSMNHTHSFSGTTSYGGEHTHRWYDRNWAVQPGSDDKFAGNANAAETNLPKAGSHMHSFSGITGVPSTSTTASSSIATTATSSISSTSPNGSGTSGNLQPYITVYMWKRTA